jgi:hypothetical protein
MSGIAFVRPILFKFNEKFMSKNPRMNSGKRQSLSIRIAC